MSSWIASILLVSIPGLLALSGWWFGREKVANAGRSLQWVTYIAMALFVVAVFCAYWLPSPSPDQMVISVSNLSLVMLGLVLFMTIILVAFSRNYMAGELRLGVYWRWLLSTIAAVVLVVVSNHLLLFWLGWVSISLALHKLLTFYHERPRAALAAHKKFLLARTAETLLLAAIGLLYMQYDTFMISQLMAHFNEVAINPNLNLTVYDHIAALLIANVALIKCAQLPVHGWLIQVVEAPTPVSSLLHAGVINLGGFLLILFAPLFMQAPVAQWLVLIVAGLTTVISALIMTTRISFKVRLAWSTNAQMGLMLLECALGLFELALLHLLAHSAYKAYSFLHSGGAVYADLQRRLSPSISPTTSDWFIAVLCSCAAVGAMIWWLDYQWVWSVWLLLGLALTMLIAQRRSLSGNVSIIALLVLAIVLLLCYSALKTLFALVVPIEDALRVTAFSAADLWAMALFIALFTLSWLLRFRANSPAMQKLSVSLFAGLYLDEWLTRLTLKVWPVRLPMRAHAKVLGSKHRRNVKGV